MKLIEVADEEKTGMTHLRQLLVGLATVFPGKFKKEPGKTVSVHPDDPHIFLEVMHPEVKSDTIDIWVNLLHSRDSDLANNLKGEIDNWLTTGDHQASKINDWPTSQSLDGFQGHTWHVEFPKELRK